MSRKRGFMVVPYGGVAATSSGSDIEGGDRVVFDKPLKVFSVNKAEDKRRERREAAMNRSRLAHQYREAKRTGGDIQSPKSMLNLLRKQTSKKNMERQSSRSFREEHRNSPGPGSPHSSPGGSGSASQHAERMAVLRSMHMNAHAANNAAVSSADKNGSGIIKAATADPTQTAQQPLPPSLSKSSGSPNNVSLRNIDSFIGNTVPDASVDGDDDDDDGLGRSDDDDDDVILDESDDSAGDDSVMDSDVDDDDDDDDDDDLGDFGVDGSDIIQIDGTDAMDDLFADLVTKKPIDETVDIQQWNHTMVGAVLFGKPLISGPGGWDRVLGVRCGQHESIVGRSYMEDRSYACCTEPREGQRCPLAMFSVFDGHNGDYVAVGLQSRYAATFREFLAQQETRSDFAAHYEARVAQAFDDTCAALDLDILERDFVRQQKNLKSGIQDIQSFAGSVGVTVAIMPVLRCDRGGSLGGGGGAQDIQVFVSHVGDCRAVLSSDGIAIQLTEDHKAGNKSERARIEAAGGWVANGRVNGSLGVSRSFGDIQFKNFDGTAKSAYGEDGVSGIWGRNQQVVSKPEFKHFVVESTFEFLILASDGLWDVFSCQEAVNFVRKQLSTSRDLNRAASELIAKATSRGTQDNTSVIIVAFHQFE